MSCVRGAILVRIPRVDLVHPLWHVTLGNRNLHALDTQVLDFPGDNTHNYDA